MKSEYIKEEITTYREIVKLIVIIIVALIGSMVSLALKFIEVHKFYYGILFVVNFSSVILFFMILFKVWNKMYEFKFKLKDEYV